MKSSASESKPFQSRSKGEIPGRARRKERLSRSKLKQAFLIDSDAELFMYLIQCIRFGSWKVRRLNRALAMFTQHRMAFLADTKSYLGKSEQHDNDTKLVLAIGTSHFGREAWFSRSQFLTPVSEGSSPLSYWFTSATIRIGHLLFQNPSGFCFFAQMSAFVI